MSKHFDMPARTQIIFKMYSHIYFVSENITLAALRQTDIFGIYSQRAVPLLLVWSHKPPRNYHDFSITFKYCFSHINHPERCWSHTQLHLPPYITTSDSIINHQVTDPVVNSRKCQCPGSLISIQSHKSYCFTVL